VKTEEDKSKRNKSRSGSFSRIILRIKPQTFRRESEYLSLRVGGSSGI